jgi:beta-galactosidase GanA
MEFKHLNQPEFDKEREKAVEEILDKDWWRDESESTKVVCRRSYNEGAKYILRFIQKEYYNPDIPDSVFEELIAEVDKIDKEGT